MAITFSCGCGRVLKVADQMAGKRVKCPKCQSVATAPAAEPEFEVVEDEPPPRAKPAPAKTKAKPPADDGGFEVVEDDEDEKPKKKPAKARRDEDDEDEEEDERPRKKKRRRDEDDEDDERPRKKRKKKRAAAEEKPFWKTRSGMILNGCGLIVLGGAGIAIYFFTDSSKRLGGLIAGILCILFGLGSIGAGIAGNGEDDDEDDE